MNTEAFLAAHLPQPGIVAAAISRPDRTVRVRRDGNAMTTAQVEQVVGKLIAATDALKRQHVEPLRVCWTFEQARIHFARRSDGTSLALLLERSEARAEAAALAIVEAFNHAWE